jgi:hypothetical protein
MLNDSNMNVNQVIYMLFILAMLLDHATTTIGLSQPAKPDVVLYEANQIVIRMGLTGWLIMDLVLVSIIIGLVHIAVNLRSRYSEFIPCMLIAPMMLRFYVCSTNIVNLMIYFNS